jgi:hypothetical protein
MRHSSFILGPAAQIAKEVGPVLAAAQPAYLAKSGGNTVAAAQLASLCLSPCASAAHASASLVLWSLMKMSLQLAMKELASLAFVAHSTT